MAVKAKNFAEELQDYIAANSSLGLIIPKSGTFGNFTIGDLLNIDNLENLFGSEILCTIYEEGGIPTRTGRRLLQERNIRFLWKGTAGQLAVNSCWDLWEFLENQKAFSTPTFSVRVARADTFPTVIAADESGTHLADFVVTFLVVNRSE